MVETNDKEQNIYKQIMDRAGFLIVSELAELLGVSPRAIQRRIQRGGYTTAKQVSGSGIGRGGKVWQIEISDPAIPNKIKSSYLAFISTSGIIPSAERDKAYLNGPSVSPPQRGQLVTAPAQHVPVHETVYAPAQLLTHLSEAATDPSQLTSGQTVTLRQIAKKAEITYRAIKMRAKRESWISCGTTIIHHNKAKLYMVKGLPADIRALFEGDAASSPSPQSPELLKQWQRDVMTARLKILAELKRFISESDISTMAQAIKRFLNLLASDVIDTAITNMVDTANHRKGNDRSITKGTIYRWIREQKEYGNYGLAPADKGEMAVPPWAREFLALWRRPQKPTVPAVLEEMGDRAPSYGQACRFLKKFSRLDAQRGRMSGSELRSIRGYTRRDKSNLMPLDVVVADGHSLKAKAAHPVHGRPFHPEMEGIIDAATRVCIGWSIGLAESSHVVADALRHAVTVNEQKPFGGVPAIFYADQGSGNTAKSVSHTDLGVLARIGAQFKTGIPGNPQGRGLIEKLQESLWIRAAKQLPTYSGKDMDRLAQRRITKIMNKDIAQKGTSDQLITWSQFITFCAHEVDAYNNRPHRALPKITDPRTGLRRNTTPVERWQTFIAEGWRPTLLCDDEIKDLFRPQIKAVCRRAQVTVFTNVYYNKLLEHYHGEEVIVCYDIHDAKTVQIRDREQRLICEAVWDANKRDYFPVPVIEQARQRRMEGRLQRLENKAWEARQEAQGAIKGNDNGDSDLEILRSIAPPEPKESDIAMTMYEDLEEEETPQIAQQGNSCVGQNDEVLLDELDDAIAMDTNEESAAKRKFEIVLLDSEEKLALRTGTDSFCETRPIKRPTIRVSRVNSLGRESLENEKKIFRAGTLTVDLGRRLVKVGDINIDLLPQEFRLIAVLMAHRGRVFSRKELLRAISRISSEERLVDVCIRRLRVRLERVGCEKYIITRKGHGYCFYEADL